MELRVLEYFLAVAREGTISGAADTLHITQPTLSRQLRDLEKELGVTLFARGHRHVTLTNEGMLLRQRAEEILSLVTKTEEDISASGQNISGTLNIGAGETRAFELVADAIARLQAQHPGIKVNLFSSDSATITERLDKGLLDFGVVIDPVDLTRYEFISLPQKDAWVLAVPEDDPLAKKSTITPQDIGNHPVMYSVRPENDNLLTKWHGSHLNAVCRFNLFYNALLMAEKNGAYILTMEMSYPLKNGLVTVPLDPPVEVGLSLIHKKDQVMTDAMQAFLTTIKTIMAGKAN